MEEPLYELLKDISLPGMYYRAGNQKTKSEWIALFPHAFTLGENVEWFISLPLQEEKTVQDTAVRIVSEVFQKMGLRSISYRMAAEQCIRQYVAEQEEST